MNRSGLALALCASLALSGCSLRTVAVRLTPTSSTSTPPATRPRWAARATLDFRLFAAEVARLGRGGVYLNVGSAVVLPEVFLKAVALARNRGHALAGLTTVSLDFIRHYRPQTNVVLRPTQGTGRGYSLVGHHELMIPLLAAMVKGRGR